jgi:hypothetical protein
MYQTAIGGDGSPKLVKTVEPDAAAPPVASMKG